MSGAGIVARARAAIDAPFRLLGRDPLTGVDCVGLAALALERPPPGRYALRMDDVGRAEQWLAAAGLERVADGGADGDLLLVRPGPLQMHVMVAVPGGFVHAHAGLRRVVEMPGPSPWPVIGRWRVSGTPV